MDTREKLEELREKQSSWVIDYGVLAKYFLISLAVVGGTALALYWATSPSSIAEFGEDTSQPDIEGQIINVTVDDERATPSRPTISREDGVRFINNANHELRFEFERNVETFTLEPDESKIVDVTAIVYYDVTAVEDVEFRQITAGINVQ